MKRTYFVAHTIVLCHIIVALATPAAADRLNAKALNILTPAQFVYKSTQKSSKIGRRGEFIIETTPLSGNTIIAIRGQGVNFHCDDNGVWRDRKSTKYENSLQVQGTPYPLVTLLNKTHLEPKTWSTHFGPVETPRSQAARELFARFRETGVKTCLHLMLTEELKAGEFPLPQGSVLKGPVVVKEDSMLGVSVWSFQFAFVPKDGRVVRHHVCLSQDKGIPFLVESVQAETSTSSTIRLTSTSLYQSAFQNR